MEPMEYIDIEKFGERVFKVRFFGSNRSLAEKELQAYIAGRKYIRYVSHFDPNTQIIELADEPTKA
jgi:hypothetical protein